MRDTSCKVQALWGKVSFDATTKASQKEKELEWLLGNEWKWISGWDQTASGNRSATQLWSASRPGFEMILIGLDGFWCIFLGLQNSIKLEQHKSS